MKKRTKWILVTTFLATLAFLAWRYPGWLFICVYEITEEMGPEDGTSKESKKLMCRWPKSWSRV